MKDVELMLGKELVSACMFPMLLELAAKVLHERGVELVQRESVTQAPFPQAFVNLHFVDREVHIIRRQR